MCLAALYAHEDHLADGVWMPLYQYQWSSQGSRDMVQPVLQHGLGSILSLGVRGEAPHGWLGCLPLPCAAAQCWLRPQHLWELSYVVAGFAPVDKHWAIVRGACACVGHSTCDLLNEEGMRKGGSCAGSSESYNIKLQVP